MITVNNTDELKNNKTSQTTKENSMTRKEFLQKTAFGAAAAALALKFGIGTINTVAAEQNGENKDEIIVSDTAPSDTTRKWIDTANGGILKYWNGFKWEATKQTWG